MTKLILAIDRVTSKQTQITDSELTIVTESQARALLGLVEAAYSHARQLLSNEYGDVVDLNRIDNAFQEGLRIEAAQAKK